MSWYKLLTPASLLTIKGAPEILLNNVSRYVTQSGTTADLDAATQQQISWIKDEWSSQGKRVILLARKVISRDSIGAAIPGTAFETEMQRQAKTGLTLVGLVGIVDPPRPEIPEVVRTIRGAGIRIFMVSIHASRPTVSMC